MMNEAELHAYVDDCLPPARHGEVEAYLAEHPEDAVRLQVYREQNEALRAAFAPLLVESLPASLRSLSEDPGMLPHRDRSAPHGEGRWSPRRSWLALAAGVVVATLGGVAGWLGHAQFQVSQRMAQVVPLSRQAAVAHAVFSPDVRRPVEVTAEQEEQLVKWLSKRLGTSIAPPKLGSLGYELVGGRLLPGNVGPVAQFMYQDGAGQRLTLYVTTENAQNRDTAFRFAREGEVNVFYWIDGKFGYALSGSIAKPELARVATAVYEVLENRP